MLGTNFHRGCSSAALFQCHHWRQERERNPLSFSRRRLGSWGICAVWQAAKLWSRSVASMAGDTCRGRGTGTVSASGQRRPTKRKFHHFELWGLGELKTFPREVWGGWGGKAGSAVGRGNWRCKLEDLIGTMERLSQGQAGNEGVLAQWKLKWPEANS